MQFKSKRWLSLTIAASLGFVATPALGQQDPSQMKEWGPMFTRIDKVVDPYRIKLGLAHYWGTYCYDKTNDKESAHPKDGSYPLGIPDWRSLNHDNFKTALGVLEEYKTASLLLCLADVKARLNAAEAR